MGDFEVTWDEEYLMEVTHISCGVAIVMGVGPTTLAQMIAHAEHHLEVGCA